MNEIKKAKEKSATSAKELENMNQLMVGRELKMIELKEEIQKLKIEIHTLKEKK